MCPAFFQTKATRRWKHVCLPVLSCSMSTLLNTPPNTPSSSVVNCERVTKLFCVRQIKDLCTSEVGHSINMLALLITSYVHDKAQTAGERNATWQEWTRAIFSLAGQTPAPELSPRRLFTWPTGERESWHSVPPALLPPSHSHCRSLPLMTKIKPWNNILNAEKGSSITPRYSSLPSTCFTHHLPSMHCLTAWC